MCGFPLFRQGSVSAWGRAERSHPMRRSRLPRAALACLVLLVAPAFASAGEGRMRGSGPVFDGAGLAVRLVDWLEGIWCRGLTRRAQMEFATTSESLSRSDWRGGRSGPTEVPRKSGCLIDPSGRCLEVQSTQQPGDSSCSWRASSQCSGPK